MNKPISKKIPLKRILTVAFIAGTLDGAAAVIFLAKFKFAATFKYIASAVFGKEAFSGGTEMILAGILFHYLIAFSFTLFYAFCVTKVKFLSTNKVVSGILYGLFVWAVMNLIVVPSTRIPQVDFDAQRALLNAVILVFCIGLPISLLISRERH
jgi:hypothetical protein